MERILLSIAAVLIAFSLFALNSCKHEKSPETENESNLIDLVQARRLIEGNVKQFAEDFNRGDSLAVASHYASDGTFGSIKGKDLVSAWGSSIRNAAQNGTPNVRFTTNSLFSDGEYLVEIGLYEFLDHDDNAKSQGKYLVVWKQEGGKWKMYRDIGL